MAESLGRPGRSLIWSSATSSKKDFLFVPGYENAPFLTAVRNRLQKLRLQPFIYTHTLYATPHVGHNIKRYIRRNARGLGGMRTARSSHLTRLGSRGSTDFWRRGSILTLTGGFRDLQPQISPEILGAAAPSGISDLGLPFDRTATI